jgi:uncharacterized protein (DUF2147 family)
MKSQTNDNFIGFWMNEDNSQTIEIYKLENSYYGKLIHTNILNSSNKVNNNVIIQMKKKSEKVLYGGMYDDLINKNQYEIKLKLTDQNHFYLKRFFRFLNKRYYWYRFENDSILAKN